MQIEVSLKTPHPQQRRFIESKAKRLVCRAARRGGKTVAVSILAVIKLLEARRILYATPTQEQVGKFWWEITTAMKPAIDAGLYYKNETEHVIRPAHGISEARIKAKTAWNANTLRGDYADLLILDEYQLMDPDVWARVGAPMLLDNDGDCIFIYTPEQTALHASQLFKKARILQEAAERRGEQPRWEVFHWTSLDNPHLSKTALDEITSDMSSLNYRLEIMAEDIDDDPRALWNRELLSKTRVLGHPELERIVVAVDPPGSTTGECGIVVAGSATKGDVLHGYVLEDGSISGSPATWAGQAVALYNKYQADRLIAERNFGGDMVEQTFKSIDPTLPVKLLTASRGKIARAEPIEALYEKGRCHHVGEFQRLEDELCSFHFTLNKGMPSPNRLDAMVWALTELMLDYCATELGSVEIPML
ncbi:MAG: hypothetical protein EHM35_00625 [Planctomycetaceae bacterium]|nr:MAG: hypothetical protein EHM35_00625 [Planctomycetaceae bacterium]